MTDHITALAGTIAKLAKSGGTKLVNGTTMGAPASGIVQVDLGAGRIVPAKVPGSFRANVANGQNVRLTLAGNTYTIESVLTALAAPTVAAPPSASGIAPGANNTGSSGQYSWTDNTQMGTYVDEMSGVTRALAGDINELRDDVGWNADDLASLKSTVNSLRTTVDAMRNALLAQGHVV